MKPNLSSLYAKKVKLSSRVSEQKRVINEKAKELSSLEQNLDAIESELDKQTLDNYFISIENLRKILLKKYPEKDVDSLIQTTLKKTKNEMELKQSNPSYSSIECWTCSCEGRMNICPSNENCPIEWKAKCDGAPISALFLKKEE